MIMLSLPRLLLAAMLFTLSLSTSVMAATVSIVPSGDASYVIQGNGMDGVAGIELNIKYDATLLKGTPAVKQESLVSGAMLAANTSLPGSIKIAIISTKPFSGSGPIATITFASKSSEAPLPSFTSSMIDSKGAALVPSPHNQPDNSASSEVTATLTPLVSQPTQTGQTPVGTTTTGTTTPRSTKTPTYLGTVSPPDDLQQQIEPQPAPSSTRPIQTDEAAASVTEQPHKSDNKPIAGIKADESQQYIFYKGVLDRFKQYRGSKNLSAVAGLFDKRVVQAVSQNPIVVLSNGQSKATITIDIPGKTITAPNFAVNGGTLVSFRQNDQMKGRWIAEVLPEAGLLKVTVTIIAGAEAFEFPLNVAPPVKTALVLDENGWSRFLKEVGTTSTPQHDFNNDGVRNYIDEYIFIANYLSNKTSTAKPAATKVPKKK